MGPPAVTVPPTRRILHLVQFLASSPQCFFFLFNHFFILFPLSITLHFYLVHFTLFSSSIPYHIPLFQFTVSSYLALISHHAKEFILLHYMQLVYSLFFSQYIFFSCLILINFPQLRTAFCISSSYYILYVSYFSVLYSFTFTCSLPTTTYGYFLQACSNVHTKLHVPINVSLPTPTCRKLNCFARPPYSYY